MRTGFLRNVRYAFRLVLANKGFSAVAIFAIALGIGSIAAMFSTIWGVMLQPLPYPEANRMMVVWSKINGERNGIPTDDYLEYVQHSHLLTTWAFSAFTERHMTTPGDPEPINGGLNTPGLTAYAFASQPLGHWAATHVVIAPIEMGRDYTPNDGKPGSDRVTIINHNLWVQRFHSDPHILGRQVLIDGEPYTIIGVRIGGFADKQPNTSFDTPLALVYGVHDNHWGFGFARLKPGVTREQAEAELAAITRHVVIPKHPKGFPPNWAVSLEPFHNDWLDPKLQRNLWLLFASVGFVLLIACANVASLLLANGISREKEIALRTALGASRLQIFARLLAESVMLAGIGGICGIGLGWVLMKLATVLLPQKIMPIETDIRMSWPVLLFTLVATVISGILFGCAPGIQSLRVNLHDALKQGSRAVLGGNRIRVQGVLVVAEFGLALTLLAGAGLAIHSFLNLTRADLGFRTDHIVTAFLTRPQKPITNTDQIRSIDERILQNVASIPGVESASLSIDIPLDGHDTIPFSIAGQPSRDRERLEADANLVTPSFQKVFGVKLLRGRFFTGDDRLGTQRVAVVSRSFASRYLAHQDPLSSRVLVPDFKPYANQLGPPLDYQIVGVIDDVRFGSVTDKNTPSFFLAFWQNPWPGLAVSVRSELSSAILTPSIRSAVSAVAPQQPLTHFQTMQQLIGEQLVNDRFGAALYAAFSCLALVLAAVGIYGVMTFAVEQRRHEMGLRMALGAQPEQVVKLVLRNGMRLAAIGIGVGIIGAVILARIMHSALYRIGSFDWTSFITVATVLLTAALVANYVPARRATQADPLVALRQE
ncbi:MAG: ABC transporter permease [Acidobacteriaceae bacterium]|nr:ABC transporter permease [Acidobacteriaceae bacterium]